MSLGGSGSGSSERGPAFATCAEQAGRLLEEAAARFKKLSQGGPVAADPFGRHSSSLPVAESGPKNLLLQSSMVYGCCCMASALTAELAAEADRVEIGRRKAERKAAGSSDRGGEGAMAEQLSLLKSSLQGICRAASDLAPKVRFFSLQPICTICLFCVSLSVCPDPSKVAQKDCGGLSKTLLDQAAGCLLAACGHAQASSTHSRKPAYMEEGEPNREGAMISDGDEDGDDRLEGSEGGMEEADATNETVALESISDHGQLMQLGRDLLLRQRQACDDGGSAPCLTSNQGNAFARLTVRVMSHAEVAIGLVLEDVTAASSADGSRGESL